MSTIAPTRFRPTPIRYSDPMDLDPIDALQLALAPHTYGVIPADTTLADIERATEHWPGPSVVVTEAFDFDHFTPDDILNEFANDDPKCHGLLIFFLDYHRSAKIADFVDQTRRRVCVGGDYSGATLFRSVNPPEDYDPMNMQAKMLDEVATYSAFYQYAESPRPGFYTTRRDLASAKQYGRI